MVDAAGEGRIEGRVHHYPVRVFYEDTDFSGVVYHANYVRYFERGRSDFLRMAGVRHRDLADATPALGFAINRLEIDFKKPARIDDLIEVRTVYTLVKGPRIYARQAALSRDMGLLARGRIEACCITLDGRPRRLPGWTIERLGPYVGDPPAGFETL